MSKNAWLELVAKIEQSPFDDDLRLELASAMIQEGAPRGYLIKEQCAPDPDVELVNELLEKHGRRWAAMADLDVKYCQIPEGATFEFYKGFAWWPVQVQYDSFQNAIDAGRYDIVHKDVTAKNLCVENARVVINAKVVLYAPNREITSPRAIWEMRRLLDLHVDQDQIWELCAFGEKYPDAQLHFPIVALGSVCVDSDGDRSVPYLGGWDAKRKLYLIYWVDGWHPSYRFLAVRK